MLVSLGGHLGQVGDAQYLGAAGQQYNAGLDAYNARQAGSQGMMSGLSGIASAGIMAF